MLMRDMHRRRTHPSVAVIGSGVIGLTVAAELRRRWRTLPIAMYTKELDVRKTTSYIAGGQFGPSKRRGRASWQIRRRGGLAHH